MVPSAGYARGSEARVEEDEDEGAVSGAFAAVRVAASNRGEDLLLGEGLDELLWHLDVLHFGEGVSRDVVVAEEPGEEGSCLALPTPLSHRGDFRVRDITQETVDVGGGEGVDGDR